MKKAKILQASLEAPGDTAKEPIHSNKQAFLGMLDYANRFDPDFVVTQELALCSNIEPTVDELDDISLNLPNDFTDQVSEYAKKMGSYIWIPCYEQEGDDIFNAAGLVSPEGEYLGVYRKVAPTVTEIEELGITPGDSLPVWRTEFGVVGMSICWDVRFDEIALSYRAKGVDIMFHPSRGVGHQKLAHWAKYHGFYVIYCHGTAHDADLNIYTPHGNQVGRITKHPTSPSVELDGGGNACFSRSEVNTNMCSLNRGNINYEETELNRIQKNYPESISIHELREEGIIVIESTDESIQINDIIKEYNLKTIDSSEKRTRGLVNKMIVNTPILNREEIA
jgi:predicted amidohydrolase